MRVCIVKGALKRLYICSYLSTGTLLLPLVLAYLATSTCLIFLTGRDALSKAIYSKLFDYLIAKINEALLAGGSAMSDADATIIGIVDIFGFEVSQK